MHASPAVARGAAGPKKGMKQRDARNKSLFEFIGPDAPTLCVNRSTELS